MSAHEQLEARTVTVPDIDVTLEASRLICTVYDAVQQVRWPASGRSLNVDPTPDAVLQSVLTYCYAVGILGSDEIASAAQNDPVAEYLCANYNPTPETIRNFRRRHISFVKASVATLLRLLATGTAGRAESYSAYSYARLERFSPHETQKLAAQRVSRAVQTDSHALDV